MFGTTDRNSLELDEFGLGTIQDYHYLNQSGCFQAEGLEDASDFDIVCDSMHKLGFSGTEMRTIFR